MTENIIIAIITSLLSSSVLVGIMEFLKWNKDNKINYITNERKKWRDDLRIIALNLSESRTKAELDSNLTKLKVRINAKGISTKLSTSEDKKTCLFSHDGYLWAIINHLEQEKK